MTPAEATKMDEELVLAALLAEPYTHRWELDGLSGDLFANPALRLVARALIRVRDTGRRVHWKRVRSLLRRRQVAAAELVEPLRYAGSLGLTASVSRLHQARAARDASRKTV